MSGPRKRGGERGGWGPRHAARAGRRLLAVLPMILVLLAALAVPPPTGSAPLDQLATSTPAPTPSATPSPLGAASPSPTRSATPALLLSPTPSLTAALSPSPSPPALPPPLPSPLPAATPVPETAPPPGVVPETGFQIGSGPGDPFAQYYGARGGLPTFGYPTSRPFLLLGTRVQFFQRYVMQQLPGRVALLNILDEDFMPYTDFGSATIPPSDSALAAAAPPPGAPAYGQAVTDFLTQNVPNTWNGQPVGYLDAFLQVGRAGGEPDPVMQALVGLEVLGFPTSAPQPDPRNTLFVYQRFQRAILQYDATTGLTQPLLMADYLKAILTGQNLPGALAVQAQPSRLYLQYQPGLLGWVARPDVLPNTDMTLAFQRQTGAESVLPTPPVGGPTASPAAPTDVPTSAPAGTNTPTRNPARPVIDHVEPGGAAAGQDVILRGHDFGDQPGQVLFTGKAVNAQVWSDTSIIVTVPGEAVDGTIRVRRPDGQISAGVGFAPYTTPTGTATVNTATPTLSPTPTGTLTPTSTPTAPSAPTPDAYYGPVGSTLLLQGSGFGSAAGQVIIGNQAAPVAQWSNTSIVVTIPSALDSQASRTLRVRIVRADGAASTSITCFIISPGTPMATPAGQPSATPTPTPPTGC